VRLTKKGVPAKRRVRAPKPLAERLKNRALKQVKRIERTYSRECKIEVLLYLLNHRIDDVRPAPRRQNEPVNPTENEPVNPTENEPANPAAAPDENAVVVWRRALHLCRGLAPLEDPHPDPPGMVECPQEAA
jgi:hypothetical protein